MTNCPWASKLLEMWHQPYYTSIKHYIIRPKLTGEGTNLTVNYQELDERPIAKDFHEFAIYATLSWNFRIFRERLQMGFADQKECASPRCFDLRSDNGREGRKENLNKNSSRAERMKYTIKHSDKQCTLKTIKPIKDPR